jgi:propionyl-CoA synthetase
MKFFLKGNGRIILVLRLFSFPTFFSIGTTGRPKGIVRDTGGYAVALKYSMNHFFNMRPGDVFWASSDVGWVVGHSYIVYGPLLHGCTTVMYEGKPVGTPDAGAFWRVISDYNVKALFTAPTAFRAIEHDDPRAELPKKYDLSCLESLFLAGEHSDPKTIHWIEHALPNIPAPAITGGKLNSVGLPLGMLWASDVFQ